MFLAFQDGGAPMEADSLKQQIQSEYRRILEAGALRRRPGQRRMIAEIFNALVQCGEHDTGPVCVVEAGTGTGKTLAYLLACLPLAMRAELKLVLATATISLQEQLVNKDIPQLLEFSGLSFSYALAKGRGRYLCLLKLENLLHGDGGNLPLRELFAESSPTAGVSEPQLWQEMHQELAADRWHGDRDDWHEPLSRERWQPLTAQRGECLGPRCRLYRKCSFFQARFTLDKADCIVANHDLVLTDLALGGGVALPPPEECIYVFDEAHHLPGKSNRHFAQSLRVRAEAAWLEQSRAIISRMAEQQAIEPGLVQKAGTLLAALEERLQSAWLLLQELRQPDGDSYRDRVTQTFRLGEAPPQLREFAATLATEFKQLEALFERAREHLRDALEEDDDEGEAPSASDAESWFPLAGSLFDRATLNRSLWESYASATSAGEAPWARWLSFDDGESESGDIGIASSPVLAADNLRENLWQRCAGAVLTSATLSALGEFSMLQMQAGLPDHARYLSLPSPFRFAEAACLEVPRMGCEPSDARRHTDCIIEALPQLLDSKPAALMLFSSRSQMREVLAGLAEPWRELTLCQDDHQKFELLRKHRERIDQGEGSIIFGLSSFAEGVDLPGKYCNHVLIARIPFAVPTEPVEQTLAHWLEHEQRNPFVELSLPQAAFRLKQACGRLLRGEDDSGRITLFDERIARKFYGKALLDSLPPFRRELLQRDCSLPSSAATRS